MFLMGSLADGMSPQYKTKLLTCLFSKDPFSLEQLKTCIFWKCLKNTAFSHSLNINVPISSYGVDRGVQAILGGVCHSAHRGSWTVHPRWSGLWHQKLETEPTDRSISVCHHSHIHMVYSVCIFVCCMFCVILEVKCGSFFSCFHQVHSRVGQVAFEQWKDRRGQRAD